MKTIPNPEFPTNLSRIRYFDISTQTLDIPQVINLRPAQFSDYAAIARLHAENWRLNYRGILSDHYLDHDVEMDRLDTWHERLQSPDLNQIVMVATVDENVVGFACLFLGEDPVYGSYLDNLHVTSKLQKSGIGRMLIKDCARIILNNTTNKNLYLWVYESNQNARTAYERLGGMMVETVEKLNESGTKSNVCRYTWQDVTSLL